MTTASLSFLIVSLTVSPAFTIPPSLAEPETRGVSGIVWRRQDYEKYVTRSATRPDFIRRELRLSEIELNRAEKLLQSGIVRTVLLESTSQPGSAFYMEKDSGRVVIAGPVEPVAALQTMIVDELTFILATRSGSTGNTLVVLSLVDPVFLERDPERASQIAEDNYEGARRILKPQTPEYRRSGMQVQFNRDLGTATILDSPIRIEKVREYLAIRPYTPRRTTY
jgi:hypothetical protein